MYFVVHPIHKGFNLNTMQLRVSNLMDTEVEVIDTDDFTTEVVNGNDVIKIWRERKDKFININPVFSGLSITWNTGTYKFKHGICIVDKSLLTIRCGYKIFKVVGFLDYALIFIEKNESGYYAKVLDRAGLSNLLLYPKGLFLDGDSISFILVDGIRITLGRDGVSLQSEYGLIDLDTYLGDYLLYKKEDFNCYRKRDMLVKLKNLVDSYPLSLDRGKECLDFCLTDLDLGELGVDELSGLAYLSGKFGDKEVKAKVARELFSRKG